MFEVIYSSGWFVGWVVGAVCMAITLLAILKGECLGICPIDGLTIAAYAISWPLVVVWVFCLIAYEYVKSRQRKSLWESQKFWRPRG